MAIPKAPDAKKVAKTRNKPAPADGGVTELPEKVFYKITVGDDTRLLDMARIGPGDFEECQVQTRLSLAAVFGDEVDRYLGTAILWWLATRKSGRPGWTWKQAKAEFPSLMEASQIPFEVMIVDGDGDPIEESADVDEDVEGFDPEA